MSSSHNYTAAGTLEELLSYHDERFIHSAYHTLLGRAPDPEGMRYYLARARDGINKVEILSQLRHSSEGRSREVKISGLNEAVRRHKQLKTPLLGPLLRLAGLKQVEAAAGKKSRAAENGIPLGLVDLLEEHGINEDDLPQALTLETIHRLNPHDHFDDIYQAVSTILQQSSIRKLRIFDEDELNADFYAKLALNHETAGRHEQAIELYRLSLLFVNTPKAHEHLGNLALDIGRHHQAIAHYKTALDLNNQSHWVYANLARAQELSGQHEEAVRAICAGIKAYPGAELLTSRLDGYIDSYWNSEDQKLECVAVTQNREKLIAEYDRVTTFISNQYAEVFKINSGKPLTNRLNSKRVLIVGLPRDVLPQCFRYRIEQKIEQLAYAGYEAETVAWYEQESALNLINFYDIIIFYRVPAFPGMLKLVEYAKSLGKITFYEVDDMLFEPNSVPPIETYGGQLSLSAYTNVTKDIGSGRAMASKCDYAIASTLPLIEKLAPLVATQVGYLHRNGLDKYTQVARTVSYKKDYINLFYGSGTLAHNTDFIIEALPAISRILKEHKDVKLTIVGNLTLPDAFLRQFGDSVIRVPLVRDIVAYWTYLSASDINLAVLHDDVLNGCKSELKWFEAATFSIPSIVSRTKNYLDVIKHGEDGFVVSGESEWYATLKKLIGNPNLRQSIGRQAHERVKAEYSVETLAKNIDHIIKNAVSEHCNASEKRAVEEIVKVAK